MHPILAPFFQLRNFYPDTNCPSFAEVNGAHRYYDINKNGALIFNAGRWLWAGIWCNWNWDNNQQPFTDYSIYAGIELKTLSSTDSDRIESFSDHAWHWDQLEWSPDGTQVGIVISDSSITVYDMTLDGTATADSVISLEGKNLTTRFFDWKTIKSVECVTTVKEASVYEVRIRSTRNTVDETNTPITSNVIHQDDPLHTGSTIIVVEAANHMLADMYGYFPNTKDQNGATVESKLNEDIRRNYKWFRLKSEGNESEQWITGLRVTGCDYLKAPIKFTDTTLVNTDEYQLLPEPPQGSIPVCVPGLAFDEAREDCAAQVYYKFYWTWSDSNNPPKLYDLLAGTMSHELSFSIGLSASKDLLTATLTNNFRSKCVYTNPEGCSGYELMEWLGSKQGWYKWGMEDYNKVIVSQLQSFATKNLYLESLGGKLINDIYENEMLPGEWGNYWYVKPGQTSIYRDLAEDGGSSIHCEIIMNWEPNETWAHYVFAIFQVTTSPGQTTEKDDNQQPAWVSGGDKPFNNDQKTSHPCNSSY